MMLAKSGVLSGLVLLSLSLIVLARPDRHSKKASEESSEESQSSEYESSEEMGRMLRGMNRRGCKDDSSEESYSEPESEPEGEPESEPEVEPEFEPEVIDMSDMTIMELLEMLPNLSTILALVRTANLEEALSGSGPLTVFAPDNEAFADMSEDEINSLLEDPEAVKTILLRHVIAGKIMHRSAGALHGVPNIVVDGQLYWEPLNNNKQVEDVPTEYTEMTSLGGEIVKVKRKLEEGGYYEVEIESDYGEAHVVAENVLASNGVVHVIMHAI